LAAATISLTSSQLARTKPPRPRRLWYARRARRPRRSSQASTGASVRRRSRHSFTSALRTIGCFTRLALYRYQEYEAPREQPRGSWLGMSGRVRG
jgi:hypothetical protein